VSDAIDRFLEAARVLDHPLEVRRFPEGTKTAEDAARAIGCDVAQIVKSLVFVADGEAVLALTSGANRVDTRRLAELAGAETVRRADAEEARSATGFAVGGTPPRSMYSVRCFIDPELMRHERLWAAAGTPDSVFPLTPAELGQLSGGEVAPFTEDR
jgi:prolyl-tRNA editing enzyme YbaK/EbsC (Cys-tRNA(Pro) deacylase)